MGLCDKGEIHELGEVGKAQLFFIGETASTYHDRTPGIDFQYRALFIPDSLRLRRFLPNISGYPDAFGRRQLGGDRFF